MKRYFVEFDGTHQIFYEKNLEALEKTLDSYLKDYVGTVRIYDITSKITRSERSSIKGEWLIKSYDVKQEVVRVKRIKEIIYEK